MSARSVNFSYFSLGFIFDDASGVALTNTGTYAYFQSRLVNQWPSGNMNAMHRAVYLSNASEVPDASVIMPLFVNVDSRFAAYTFAKSLLAGKTNGMWYSVSLTTLAGQSHFNFPAVKPLYNRTGGFIGLASIAHGFATVNSFLNAVKGTPSTEVFALEKDLMMTASTHAQPYFTVTSTTTIPGLLPAGCVSNVDSRLPGDPTFIGCRTKATAFTAYPPLVKAVEDKDFINNPTAQVRILEVGGENYFTVATAVQNRYAMWGMSIVLFMPESDIIGDIVKGRNIAIGVTAAVFVVAAVLSFCLVYALLQPLSDVSSRMLDTARLRETEDQKTYSVLAEICDLQKAYTNMNAAIRSFTRYVPRDVVKDLMASGQLCTIQMTPHRCTMLFVDIAGFTTVCERVPSDILSGLVSSYFDRASRVVMEHDGLIDKFIGDCIMAVWGAPFGVANQEVKAVLAGKLIDRETCVDSLARQWDEAGELLRVRVGISSGEVLAGNMGSADRMNYTVIGDPVNLAARLESMNKQMGTRVMISEMTAENCGAVFVLRLLMPIAVVGKDKPVKVYEVMGLSRQFDAADTERMQHSDEASGAFPDRGASDNNNNSEEQSTFSGGKTLTRGAGSFRNRRSKKTTFAMLCEAAMTTATERPLTCSIDDATYATQFTSAVLAYMRRDFAGALSTLANIVRSYNTSSFESSVPSSVSMQMLQDLCEKYLKEGCPADFDGVFRALEK
jgi:class 3 adenylate cyclase